MPLRGIMAMYHYVTDSPWNSRMDYSDVFLRQHGRCARSWAVLCFHLLRPDTIPPVYCCCAAMGCRKREMGAGPGFIFSWPLIYWSGGEGLPGALTVNVSHSPDASGGAAPEEADIGNVEEMSWHEDGCLPDTDECSGTPSGEKRV
jgi:hypothetical protein